MTKVLTESTYIGRKAALRDDLAAAERRFKEAALAAATGEGTPEAQREARETVAEIQDRIAALDAAWEANAALEAERAKEIERGEWADAVKTVEALAADCEAAGARAAEAFDSFIGALGEVQAFRSKMRTALEPWGRKDAHESLRRREPPSTAMRDLLSPPRVLASILLAKLGDAGLPLFTLGQSEIASRASGSTAGAFDGVADDYLRALHSFAPPSVREVA